MSTNSIAPVIIVFPEEGGTYEADLPLQGIAEPGGDVYIKEVPDTDIIKIEKVDGDGKWVSFYRPGSYKIMVGQKVNGVWHGYNKEFQFSVAKELPVIPAITRPLANEKVTPRIDFRVQAGSLDEGTESVEIEVGFRGGEVCFQKNLLSNGASDGEWGLLVSDGLGVGYYYVKARRSQGGVNSRWTAETLFSLGMP